MFRKKYLLGQQSSSLEYEAANGWIERPARGWPKFSTLVCNYGSVDVGNERGLWRGPRATRGLGSALRRSPMEKKKEKALSLFLYTFTCTHRTKIPGEPPAMEHLSTTLFTLFTFLERVLPVWRAYPNRTSPKRSFHEPIRCVFEMRSFVCLLHLRISRPPRMLKTGNKQEGWECIW